MKLFIFIIFLFLCSSNSEAKNVFKKSGIQKFWARVTLYGPHEDKYKDRVACSSKIRAKEGVTIAAHSDFPFFKSVEIPRLKFMYGNGKFIIQDRGKFIEIKKASHGKTYVFDVYLNKTNKQIKQFQKNLPEYMEVWVKI